MCVRWPWNPRAGPEPPGRCGSQKRQAAGARNGSHANGGVDPHGWGTWPATTPRDQCPRQGGADSGASRGNVHGTRNHPLPLRRDGGAGSGPAAPTAPPCLPAALPCVWLTSDSSFGLTSAPPTKAGGRASDVTSADSPPEAIVRSCAARRGEAGLTRGRSGRSLLNGPQPGKPRPSSAPAPGRGLRRGLGA